MIDALHHWLVQQRQRVPDGLPIRQALRGMGRFLPLNSR
jgi:hypothetical protein